MRNVYIALAYFVSGSLGLAGALYVGLHPDVGTLTRGIAVGAIPPLAAAAFVISLDYLTMREPRKAQS